MNQKILDTLMKILTWWTKSSENYLRISNGWKIILLPVWLLSAIIILPVIVLSLVYCTILAIIDGTSLKQCKELFMEGLNEEKEHLENEGLI